MSTAIVTAGTRFAGPALNAVKALLISFIGLESVETIWESIVGNIETAYKDDQVSAKKGGARGVVMIDLSTGLTIGRTSRRSALAHLEGKKSARYRRYHATKPAHVDVHCDGHHR